MDFSEKWGTTVEEAVSLALADLNLSQDEVDIKVIEEPSKGFFGIGAKLAKVRVFPKKVEEPAPEPEKPTPKPDPTAEPITLEDLQKAGVTFAKEKGVAVLKVLLTQMGASKICEIPKEKYQEAWEALHGEAQHA